MERRKEILGLFFLRLHHLGIWEELTSEFLKKFKRSFPWEIPDKDFSDFTNNFAGEQTAEYITGLKIHRMNLPGGIDADDAAYITDVIGETESLAWSVSEKRAKIYRDFLSLAKNPNARIILTEELDGLCKSCAIGKHCTMYIPPEIRLDFIYNNALREMLNNDRGRGFVKNNMLGITKGGNIFVTAELLFDFDFYDLLKSIVEEKSN